MPGGLLQIASSGIQDIYLTKNPEITYFKKVYRRHSNFSKQTIEINIEHIPDFGNDFFINFSTNGDLINNCYFELTIPKLNIDDSYITNNDFKNIKSNRLATLNNKKNIWKNEYDELTKFSNIQINYYRKVKTLLESNDVKYQSVLNTALIEKNAYSNKLDELIFTIDEYIISKLDLITYIINLEKSFGSIDSDTTITLASFTKNVDNIYENNIIQLKYYFDNYKYYENKYNVLNSGNLPYAWIENLSHHYFTNFELELDGRIIESYSNDYLTIHQSHNLKKDQVENYNKLIGNTTELTNLHSDKKTQKIYVPLIFWFNKSSTFSLPLIAMKNSTAKLNLSINDIKNLIYFEDFKDEYNEMLKLELPFNDHVKNDSYLTVKRLDVTNSNIDYSQIEKIDYLKNQKIYIYHFKTIIKELVKLKFPSILDSQIDKFFTNYSSDGTNITLEEWINFRINTQDYDSDINQMSKYFNYFNHYEFADFNFLINKVGYPQIKFYADYIFLDEVERFKFATNELEYVVNLPEQITINVGNYQRFTSELDLNRPSKDLIWIFKTKISNLGLTNYSYKNPNLYNSSIYYEDIQMISKFFISVQDSNLVDFTFGKNYYLFTSKYDKLNSTGINFFYESFCLYPENDQPSGNVNFSMIKSKNVTFEINQDFLTKYFNSSINKNLENFEFILFNRAYNLLKFTKGKGAFIFY